MPTMAGFSHQILVEEDLLKLYKVGGCEFNATVRPCRHCSKVVVGNLSWTVKCSNTKLAVALRFSPQANPMETHCPFKADRLQMILVAKKYICVATVHQWDA